MHASRLSHTGSGAAQRRTVRRRRAVPDPNPYDRRLGTKRSAVSQSHTGARAAVDSTSRRSTGDESSRRRSVIDGSGFSTHARRPTAAAAGNCRMQCRRTWSNRRAVGITAVAVGLSNGPPISSAAPPLRGRYQRRRTGGKSHHPLVHVLPSAQHQPW